jgi:ABC-type sugar transport system permease subunit
MSATLTEPREEVRPRRPAQRTLRRRPGERLGYAMVSPVVLVLLAITGFPLVYNVWTSLRTDILNQPFLGHGFVGLNNYKSVFSSHPSVGAAPLPVLWHTLAYSVVSVSLEIAVGLGVALLLNQPIRGRGVYRTLILLPWAIPSVLAAQIWKTLLDPQSGGVDYVLRLIGLPASIANTDWTNHVWTAWISIFIADAWQSIPFVTILLLAGLQSIPGDLYEAAKVDGAGAWFRFRYITLPLLKPALLVVLVFRTLQAFLIFDIIYGLTGAGPGNSTETVGFLTYNSFIVQTNYGLGGAVAIVTVVVVMLIAAVYFGLLGGRER